MIRLRQVSPRPVVHRQQAGNILPRLVCVLVIAVAGYLIWTSAFSGPDAFVPEASEIPDSLVNGATPAPKPSRPASHPASPKRQRMEKPPRPAREKQAPARPAASPAPVAPTPTPAPQAPAPPAATPLPATPEPTPTPAPLDAATVGQRPELWPKSVMLTRTTTLPIFFNGKMAGEAEAPAGLWLPLESVHREGDRLVILYHTSKIPLPVSSTNLMDLARQRDEELRTASAQTPESPDPLADASDDLPVIPGLSDPAASPAEAPAPTATPPPAPTPTPTPDADAPPPWILRQPGETPPGASPTPRSGW